MALKNGTTISEQNNYFLLSAPKKTFNKLLFELLLFPIYLPKWIISFIGARIVTYIAVNPDIVKRQKDTHLVSLTNDPDLADEIVVVNLLPQENNKWIHDYLIKINANIIRLPFMDKIKRRKMVYEDLEHRARVDFILAEIDALLVGASSDDKCQGKTFDKEHIYFKGLECLDDALRNYLEQQLISRGLSLAQDDRNLRLDFYSLELSDGTVLDSVETTVAAELEKPFAERKFVVSCLPQGQNFINYIKDSRFVSEQIGATVVGFNYRGVDYSKGLIWTHANMVDDIISQVERLLLLGVAAENIGLEGTSLGGSTAVIAAAKLHHMGYPVKLYTERSFRTLSRMVSGYVMPDEHSVSSRVAYHLAYAFAIISYVLFSPIAWLTDWLVDAESGWRQIPERDKRYSVVRRHPNPATGEPAVIDGMVHDSWASIASLIDEQRKEALDKIENGEQLSEDETILLSLEQERSYFIPSPTRKVPEGKQNKYSKFPHVFPRYDLVRHDHSATMQEHMCENFTELFSAPRVG